MRKKYRLSALAADDMSAIVDYIQSNNPSAARKWLNGLVEHLMRLAEHPSIGQLCEEIRFGVRSCAFGNYIVLYEVFDKGIIVLRIIHGARDLGRLRLDDQE